jgi:hypothetical protein
VTLPSSTQPKPTAGGQPDASPQLQLATGLYKTPRDALKTIRDDFSYWTGKVTETSFALSLAVIAANWAVFGSVNKLLNNIWAELSIAVVILSLGISLIIGTSEDSFASKLHMPSEMRRGGATNLPKMLAKQRLGLPQNG